MSDEQSAKTMTPERVWLPWQACAESLDGLRWSGPIEEWCVSNSGAWGLAVDASGVAVLFDERRGEAVPLERLLCEDRAHDGWVMQRYAFAQDDSALVCCDLIGGRVDVWRFAGEAEAWGAPSIRTGGFGLFRDSAAERTLRPGWGAPTRIVLLGDGRVAYLTEDESRANVVTGLWLLGADSAAHDALLCSCDETSGAVVVAAARDAIAVATPDATVRAIAPTGEVLWSLSIEGASSVSDLAYLPDAALVAAHRDGRVARISSSGTVTNEATVSGDGPSRLAVDSESGHVFVARGRALTVLDSSLRERSRIDLRPLMWGADAPVRIGIGERVRRLWLQFSERIVGVAMAEVIS